MYIKKTVAPNIIEVPTIRDLYKNRDIFLF